LENRTGRKVVSKDNYDKIAGKVKKVDDNSKLISQKKKLKDYV